MTQKIGLLGYSSHADRFSEIINVREHRDYWPESGAQVWAIWAEDADQVQAVATACGIPVVASTPEQVVQESDVVFVIARHPGDHLDLARPVIEAGKPMFVDKPMTETPQQARDLLALVEESGIPMTSFTTLRFGTDTGEYAEALAQIGPVRFASYVGPASRKNPFGGYGFYGVHSVELMLQFHGIDIVSIDAVEHPRDAERSNTVATCRYADGTTVVLGLVGDGVYHFRMTAIGHDGVVDLARGMGSASVDAASFAKAQGRPPPQAVDRESAARRESDHYPAGVRRILAALRGEESSGVSHEEMLRTIQVLSAIEESVQRQAPVDPRSL